MKEMMTDIESLPINRECSGRGPLDRSWQATVRSAANSIRHVPYYGKLTIKFRYFRSIILYDCCKVKLIFMKSKYIFSSSTQLRLYSIHDYIYDIYFDVCLIYLY